MTEKQLSDTPPKEVWYCWKIYAHDGGESESRRLLTPHSDPRQYEEPFDYLFETPNAAMEILEDHDIVDEACDDGWVLCKETLEPYAYQPF